MCNLDVQYGGFAAAKRGDGRLIYFFDIWALLKCQKNKSSVQKNFFAAEGGYLAIKKLIEVLN